MTRLGPPPSLAPGLSNLKILTLQSSSLLTKAQSLGFDAGTVLIKTGIEPVFIKFGSTGLRI